jgi:methylmalonyl-CoA mutase cobalamin-binding domain/chain
MADQKFEIGVLQEIYDAMVEIDEEKPPELTQKALKDGVDVLKIIDALTQGINKVGDKFEAMECFLPELIMAANIMDESMAFLRPELERLDVKAGTSGTIVIANLQGDIHDIGRQIATVMLRAAGITVHDLGHDVKPDVAIEKAVELKADIIGLSSLLTTSLPFARDMIKLLGELGLRDQFKVVMGGGAVTPEFSEEIGANGYGRDAAHGVRVISEILAGK